MARAELVIVVVAIGVLLSGNGRAEPPTITAHVTNVRGSKGSVICPQFSSGDGFPAKNFTATANAPIVDAAATCRFPGVAAGTYAVAVFHDENGNGKLDRNFIGIPKEGVGSSNNRRHAMGPPRWDESKLAVSGSITVEITLRY